MRERERERERANLKKQLKTLMEIVWQLFVLNQIYYQYILQLAKMCNKNNTFIEDLAAALVLDKLLKNSSETCLISN